ncbi:MAG: response regulator transcription factor [Gammaproteobacteria bacterium]|nr:response regulator transcription factor [Gammaproteobacteria bacterium]
MRYGLVLEDLPDSRAWLVEVMRRAFPDIEVSEAGTLAEARAAVQRQRPDIALIDLNLPDGFGVSLIGELNQLSPDIFTVVATIYDDDQHVFPALRAGAHGYLLKEQSQELLANLLKGIVSGEPPLSPSIARKMLRFFSPSPSETPPVELTPREQEVLRLIAKGYKLAEVARILEISRHTVADYVKNLYRKLNITTRAEATLEATRRGIVGPEG